MGTKKRRTLIGFDFETASLPDDNDTPPFPIEIAAILIDEETLEVFAGFQNYMRLPAGITIHPEAFKQHGKTAEWLAENGQSWDIVRADFLKWLADHGFPPPDGSEYDEKRKNQLIPFGQNILQFDLPILRKFMGHPQKGILSRLAVDTMLVAGFVNTACKRVYGWEGMPFRDPKTGYPSASLAAQMETFEIDASGHHGAAFDIRATLECYREHLKNYTLDLRKSAAFDSSGSALPEAPVW